MVDVLRYFIFQPPVATALSTVLPPSPFAPSFSVPSVWLAPTISGPCEVFSLKSLYLNARSLCNKLSEFDHLITCNHFHVIWAVETWFTYYILDSMILSPFEFNFYRKDRDGRGGGSCVIIRISTEYSSVFVPLPKKFSILDIICVDILFNNSNDGLRIICVYCPPNFLKDISLCQLLIDAINFFCNFTFPTCIVGGWNLPDMNWVNMTCPRSDVYELFLTQFYTWITLN